MKLAPEEVEEIVRVCRVFASLTQPLSNQALGVLVPCKGQTLGGQTSSQQVESHIDFVEVGRGPSVGTDSHELVLNRPGDEGLDSLVLWPENVVMDFSSTYS